MCKHKKKDKKRDKERAKHEETDDEKRARRNAKHEAKAVKRQEDAQVAGYSNQDNPWNDPHLAESFVWGKKTDKDRSRGVEELNTEGHKRKKLEMQVELEKVKRAREQREVDDGGGGLGGREDGEGGEQGTVLLELRFPPDFPTRPPFVRVLAPRFVMRTGHVTVISDHLNPHPHHHIC